MLGERSAQRGLFEADTMFADFVGRRNFYGFLASQRNELFRDEDFAALYCRDNGRPSVPPSLLATALVLQTYDRVSDDEATRRAAFDLQWKVALGVELDVRPFAKSTLQEFRAQLILHEQTGAIFQQSLEVAKRRGVWKKGHPQHERQQMKLALDTTHILGRGAVKDSYNLLADGIVQVLRVLATSSDPLTCRTWLKRLAVRGTCTGRVSKARRTWTGRTRKLGSGSWPRSWPMPIDCWNWCVGRELGWRRTAQRTRNWSPPLGSWLASWPRILSGAKLGRV
jgi:hypothetical protein